MNRLNLSLLVAVACIVGETTGAAEIDVVRGTEVGQAMPLHIVNFVGGARDSGKGCPSVMISNQKVRGLEIWAPVPSDEAFALARDMDVVLGSGKRSLAFIILGVKEDMQKMRDLARKYNFDNVTVCVPNSKKLFQNAKFTEESDLYVFFIDRKVIKAAHKFKASSLTALHRNDLVRQFRGFIGSSD